MEVRILDISAVLDISLMCKYFMCIFASFEKKINLRERDPRSRYRRRRRRRRHREKVNMDTYHTSFVLFLTKIF